MEQSHIMLYLTNLENFNLRLFYIVSTIVGFITHKDIFPHKQNRIFSFLK